MQEIWKDILGHEGCYQVSNFGQVHSLDRLISHPNGPTRRKGKTLKPYLTGEKRNYLTVDILDVNNKIHRLVAIAFIENPENKPEVNHINGITSDNQVSNLEWVTYSENVRHAIETGLLIREHGRDCANTKYSYNVFKDGVFIKTLIGTKEIVDFGLSSSHIISVVLGKRKSHKGFTFTRDLI